MEDLRHEYINATTTTSTTTNTNFGVMLLINKNLMMATSLFDQITTYMKSSENSHFDLW